MLRRRAAWCVAVFGVGVLAGCAENKMTRQNWEMVKEGTSTKDEVRLTLGDKYTALGNQWEYEDEDKHLHATIHFDDKGVVTRKEWMDGKSGEWTGAAPEISVKPQGRTTSEQKGHTTINKD
jgi:outer membrane protein assembly factor BamE (lipoprotein component of BamABCDE complex)